MKCDAFRNAVQMGTDDAAVRGHLRSCATCLEWAVSVDPDVMFRSIGIEEGEPPGGTDAFVADVLRQVEIRDAERRLGRRPVRFSSLFRWSAAAALAVGVLGTMIMQREGVAPAVVPGPAPAAVVAQAPIDRPVIESYDSAGATIVEVPAQNANEIQLVMIFDESLPADL
ncbi:MAG TPA: hypothetical protein VFV54_08945 [Thermoanaerobaculia bacterium]|nr:hypothetical protein [Thermoanaerobaculia bacterium]